MGDNLSVVCPNCHQAIDELRYISKVIEGGYFTPYTRSNGETMGDHNSKHSEADETEYTCPLCEYPVALCYEEAVALFTPAVVTA